MPSTAQKRTIILAVVIVACTLVILHNSQVYKFKQSTVDSVKNVIHFIPKKVQYLMWPNENTIPDTSTLQQWTLDQLSDLYFKYVNTLQVFCPVKKVYGGVKTGWYTCDVMREANSKPCVSYVIASNEKSINNNFFKELNQDYQCERNIIMNSTMAAAQSSTEIGGNSPVGTLKSKGNVDYMAVDVGGGETLLLSWMLTNGLLKNVHQLFVSFHRISADSKTSDYLEHLQILRALFAEGFRTFHFARNIQCLFKGNAGKTGCYTLYMMRELSAKGSLEVYQPERIKSMPLPDLAKLYHSLLVSSQVHCKHVIRIGDVDDGGWDVCNDTEYRPSSPCLVYSFGVAGDWSFDDEVSKIYGCEVHSFDPSIGKPDHKRSDKITFHNLGLWGRPKGKRGKWNMMNLEGIIEMLGHSGKIIDILKMDIESSEWEALPDMLATGVLKNVRQLDFEFHGEPNPNESHRSKLNALRNLNDQGFKLFWSHPNIAGGNPKTFSVTGRQVSSCYENYYLNTRLKKE